ncbi:tetratricopeptide repeat protein [Chryseobacterium sp. 6424]|uniref:type IX secretion system periplasmic lipoprotein PorW/SprE n=1 Tax=Chryseobacterium sp. 6424 TaxID=2039166 RepID=UPI000EFC9AB9|nr:tetratricopeptide repeat protein [Chryseobacterium sp. 6424]
MKKTILFLLSVAVFNSCSSRKKTNDSAFMKGFFTYYNTLFNSKDALQTEFRNRDKAHVDNFYAPYIQLLTFEDLPLDSSLEDNFTATDISGQNMGPGIPGDPGRQRNNQIRTGTTVLEIAEAKALKAIAKYSVLKGGEERNKRIFDAHILLAQSRIYQNKPLEALDGLNYVFASMRNDKRLPLAKIYQGVAYSKMGDYYRSGEVFSQLKNDSKLNKSNQKLLSVYYAEMLLHAGKKEAAVEELEDAFTLNNNRKLRSRIAFLRGQILASLGRNDEARESFTAAYKNANDFEFEVKSQVEIAKTFNGQDDDYQGAKSYLENISKKGTYASRKNEFYYALGLMANKAGKKEEAKTFFQQSLHEKMSDPQIRGLSYYEIGKAYFDNSDYLSAGAFYDSALAVMTYQPTKTLLQEKSENIKQLSQNYYLIRKNDSILALTRMPEAERFAYFNTYIEGIKIREAAEEQMRQRKERGKGFDIGDYSANSIFAGNTGGFEDFGATKGGFYFSNQSTVARGESTFRQIWGTRALGDNWRTSARSTSIEDLKNEAMGMATAPNPRRLEPQFYIEQIPTDNNEIFSLKKARDTASLALGRMYESYFSDTSLATKTLYDLVDAQPDEETKLQALYSIFAFNYEKNPSAAERAKEMIISEFPYTSYAEFVKNPRNKEFSKSSEEVEKMYTEAFSLYADEKYEDSKTLIEQALEKHPKDALVPKFVLLNAFNTGKTAGKEIMILQLEQIALNYAKTAEGLKAAEMLQHLKSDINFELTNEYGQPTNVAPTSSAPVEEVGPPAPGMPVLGAPAPGSPELRMKPPKRNTLQKRNR